MGSCNQCTVKKDGFFCGLNPNIVQKIIQNKKIKEYKKGEILFIAGQKAEGIYCIQSGKVKKVIKDPNGKDAIINIKGHGDLVGHYHLFNGENFIASAIALEDTTVCLIEDDFMMDMIQKEPSLAIHFIKHLSEELNSFDFKISSLVSKNVKSRLADLLIQMSTTYGTQQHKGIRLDVRLTREEIASLIGTANETVTRFITEFKECGIIEEREKILYIVKPEKLIEISHH